MDTVETSAAHYQRIHQKTQVGEKVLLLTLADGLPLSNIKRQPATVKNATL